MNLSLGSFVVGLAASADPELPTAKRLLYCPHENIRAAAFATAVAAHERIQAYNPGEVDADLLAIAAYASVICGTLRYEAGDKKIDGDWLMGTPADYNRFMEMYNGWPTERQDKFVQLFTPENLRSAISLQIGSVALKWTTDHHSSPRRSLNEFGRALKQKCFPHRRVSVSTLHTIGHWGSKLYILTLAQLSGIRPHGSPAHLDAKTPPHISPFLMEQFKSYPAGVKQIVNMYDALKLTCRSVYFDILDNKTELREIVDKMKLISSQPVLARLHTRSLYLTGESQILAGQMQLNKYVGSIGMILHRVYPKNGLCKIPSMARKKVESAEGYNVAYDLRLKNLLDKQAKENLTDEEMLPLVAIIPTESETKDLIEYLEQTEADINKQRLAHMSGDNGGECSPKASDYFDDTDDEEGEGNTTHDEQLDPPENDDCKTDEAKEGKSQDDDPSPLKTATTDPDKQVVVSQDVTDCKINEPKRKTSDEEGEEGSNTHDEQLDAPENDDNKTDDAKQGKPQGDHPSSLETAPTDPDKQDVVGQDVADDKINQCKRKAPDDEAVPMSKKQKRKAETYANVQAEVEAEINHILKNGFVIFPDVSVIRKLNTRGFVQVLSSTQLSNNQETFFKSFYIEIRKFIKRRPKNGQIIGYINSNMVKYERAMREGMPLVLDSVDDWESKKTSPSEETCIAQNADVSDPSKDSSSAV